MQIIYRIVYLCTLINLMTGSNRRRQK